MNFKKNNLNKAFSPYLQQHKDNPIHWQEWSNEVLEYAQQQDKLIFISIGYSTCHWCAAMRNDAFQNQAIADFLNEQCVSILIDREMRPDIDQYMLSYARQSNNNVGWPLNIVLTPDFKPFAATSYVPSKSDDPKAPTLLLLLNKALEYYTLHKDDIKAYMPPIPQLEVPQMQTIIPTIESQFDQNYGGFGQAPKFPPHATLAFLLMVFAQENTTPLYVMLKKTFDAMALGGLHDHLQGGFFRFCVDQQWAVPHFEKMLYDQAWLLWNYSAAYKVLKEESYKKIAEKLTDFVLTQLSSDTLFYSGISAETNNQEGALYLWTTQELKKELTADEFAEFSRVYSINDIDNTHLTKKHSGFLEQIEQKLLAARNKRSQPFVDRKCLTYWNSIMGVALIMAYRCTNNQKALARALDLFKKLTTDHMQGNKVFHCSINGVPQKESFFEDYASLLLFATYMYEETGEHKEILNILKEKLLTFRRENVWYESFDNNFFTIPASPFDYAIPSSCGIAQLALLRTHLLNNEEMVPEQFRPPLQCDFLNVSTLISNGIYNIIEAPSKIDWHSLPLNTLQRPAQKITHIWGGVKKEYESVDSLLNALSLIH